MKLTLFYCWQSDHSEKLCKDFIGIALREAAQRLAERRSVEIVIDSDTQNVAGQPPVADTILEKIRTADAVVTDLTFVAQTASGKLIPNPNVMAEFGYALRDKGWRRVLFTMNTAFGDPRQLPFDMGHVRFPSMYELAAEKPDGARRSARAAFSAKLEKTMEAMLDEIAASRPPPPNIRPDLEELVQGAYQSRFTSNVVAVVPEPKAFVYLAPAAALQNSNLDLALIDKHRRLLAPRDTHTGAAGQDHEQWWARGKLFRVGNLPNPFSLWRGRLLRPGVIEFAFNVGLSEDDDQETVVDIFSLEAKLVRRTDRGLELLNNIGLTGPTLISVAMEDVDSVVLNGAPRLGKIRARHLALGDVLAPEGTLQAGALMRSMIDKVWLAGGSPTGSASFSTESWAGYHPNTAYPDA